MKLFNKYKNKDFLFLTNYINNCLMDDSWGLTPQQLELQLTDDSQRTFEELILSLTNAAHSDDGSNANLLYMAKGTLQPVRNTMIPLRPSIAEKAWLYYILHSPKADLFLQPEIKQKLLAALEADPDKAKYPIQADYIDIRKLSPDNELVVTANYLTCFQTIVTAIRERRSLVLTNKTFGGKVYHDQEVYPYRLEYNQHLDSFSLSCYPVATKRTVKMNLANLSDVKLGAKIPDYEAFVKDYEQQLKATQEASPILLEIQNRDDAYYRCSYIFSSYNTFCYEKDEKTLLMHIYYYRFQKEELLRNILFLGPYVKVIGPQQIVDDIVQMLAESVQAYEDET